MPWYMDQPAGLPKSWPKRVRVRVKGMVRVRVRVGVKVSL